MPSDAIREFLEQGNRSGLFTSAEAKEAIAQLTASQVITPDSLSAELVVKKVLTAYQSEQLLAGKGEECLIAQRYRILEMLGAGAMGTVYQALDTKLDRLVAVKVLPAHRISEPDAVARFHREAKALARVSHPAIVEAHDAGEDRGQHFLVMAYVQGTNLAQIIREQGRVAPTLAADYVHQAALGLQHAHRHGVIHRDLKPSNLLVTPAGQVKILDLGLARFLQDQISDPQLTREGTGLGTPDYMAPEQFGDARQVDARADIYSLGCTLYQLLTGQVPFPGTSLAEKAEAHAEREPPPVEERSPDAPAGLVLVVLRMMAKTPADRFQSAAEVAEALHPYVRSASGSLPALRATTSWRGSQLSFTLPRRRRRLASASIAGAVLVVLVVLAVLFKLSSQLPDGKRLASAAGSAPEAAKPAPPLEPADPDMLTVSKDAKDGGQFRTIREALAKVDHAGMTIHVVDGAVYEETIHINNPAVHDGLTLLAGRRATLALTPAARIAVSIIDVHRVTIRGFRVRLDRPQIIGVMAAGLCPGVVLEDLECIGDLAASRQGAVPNIGISLELMPLGKEDDRATVRNCRISGCGCGMQIVGAILRDRQPRLCRRMLLRDNEVHNANFGILITGLVSDIQVVGNKVWSCSDANIGIRDLFESSAGLRIVNNSLKNRHQCLLLDVAAERLSDIEFRNNLILSERFPDLASVGVGKVPDTQQGWRVEQNWRQFPQPESDDLLAKEWIPASKDKVGPIQLLSQDPAHPDFLRPAKDSPLATEGAGKTDPRLPSYIGAVAPEGLSAWDWDRTWRMPKDAQLITVSKEEKDGGQFRTINDALKGAKPWATIRVLDGATYPEAIELADANRFEGVTVESECGATLEMPASARRLVTITNVPHVRVRGFRLREESDVGVREFVRVNGRVPGVVIERLEFRSKTPHVCVTLAKTAGLPDEPPLIMRNCYVEDPGEGIIVIGPGAVDTERNPAGGIAILNNHITGTTYRGTVVLGTIRRVLVAGNRVRDCRFGLQVEDLAAQSGEVLFANNTALGGNVAFRYWVNGRTLPPLSSRQVEIAGNLLFGADDVDVALYLTPIEASSAEDLAKVATAWQFHSNYRDLGGVKGRLRIPLSPEDHKLDALPLISREPSHPDFLRPAADSPLTTRGAGKGDPSLPSYVGAVPPKGVAPWDWEKTWRWRMAKRATNEQKSGGEGRGQ